MSMCEPFNDSVVLVCDRTSTFSYSIFFKATLNF